MHDAGVVDQNIDLAKYLDRMLDQSIAIGTPGDVGPHKTDGAPELLRSDLTGLADVGHNNPGAAFDKPPHARQSNALRCPGDDGNASIKPFIAHCFAHFGASSSG